jgi:plasmid stabilization system protein ParE
LDEIWYYVAKESTSIEVANRLIDSITDRFFLLAAHPQLGRARDVDFGAGLRSFPVGEYVIVYCLDNEGILPGQISAPSAPEPETRNLTSLRV